MLCRLLQRARTVVAAEPEESFGDRFRWLLRASEDHDRQVLAERRGDRQLYSVNGQYRLRPSVVTYLDTLGTTVRSSALTDELLRGDIQENDEFYRRLHSEFWRGATQRMVTFSDNVCVAAPAEDGAFGDLLRDQIDAAARFQLNRILAGRAIRGGITFGNIYCDSNYVDGPALIRAHDLEDKLAGNPRVLVEDEAAAFIRRTWVGHKSQWPYRLVAEDSDGRIFVNYLFASQTGLRALSDGDASGRTARGSSWSPPELPNHRAVIAQMLDVMPPGGVRDKWGWVARYHNWYVNEFLDGRSDLLIEGQRPLACSLL